MRRILTLAVAAVSATLSVGGCSSDSGGGSGSGQCQGDNAALTQAELSAKTSSAGKCAGDSATVCENDVNTIAEQCGADCYKNDDPAAATQNKCVSSCIAGDVSSPLSDGCLGCYIADVGCARDHCLVICGAAPTSSACLACRVSNGCAPAFYACTGLPDLVSETGAGGAGDEAGAAGAAGADAIPSAGAGGS